MRLLTFSVLRNCKFKKTWLGTRFYSETDMLKSATAAPKEVILPGARGDPESVSIASTWPKSELPELRAAVLRDVLVFPQFITEAEEITMLKEVEPQLKKMRYEYDHWDNAIQGYRETERSEWSEVSEAVLARVRAVAFPPQSCEPLPHTHVLDLAPAGHIKPHVDAVRFCGEVIAGLCLLSSAVMELQHSEHKHLTLHALLSRRCLYVLKGTARYDFTHAVLGGEQSVWLGKRLPRQRRIAVICRTEPKPEHTQHEYY